MKNVLFLVLGVVVAGVGAIMFSRYTTYDAEPAGWQGWFWVAIMAGGMVISLRAFGKLTDHNQ